MATAQLMLDFEEWRAIDDWPDYEISSLGRVRRCAPPREGYILAKKIDKDGYAIAPLRRGGVRKHKKIHILMCRAFIGQPPSPEKNQVAHNDGTRENRIDNLRWATQFENAADAIKHEKSLRGTKNPRGKLNEQDVIEIRRRLAAGDRQIDIAADFRIDQTNVSAIKRGRHWGWYSTLTE